MSNIMPEFAVFRTARIDALRNKTKANTTPKDDADDLAKKGGVKELHAWVNYDEGLSEGRGNGGVFYQAEGKRMWSHDEVYDQNTPLVKAVGTKAEPTAKIFDCTQGTVGKGKHGEATNERQLQHRASEGDDVAKEQAKEALLLLKELRKCKAAVRLSGVVPVFWAGV